MFILSFLYIFTGVVLCVMIGDYLYYHTSRRSDSEKQCIYFITTFVWPISLLMFLYDIYSLNAKKIGYINMIEKIQEVLGFRCKREE